MTETAGPTTYEELLQTFKEVLDHALHQGRLPPTSLIFDLPVIEALGRLAQAVRDGSPRDGLIAAAIRTFARYAFEQDWVPEGKPLEPA